MVRILPTKMLAVAAAIALISAAESYRPQSHRNGKAALSSLPELMARQFHALFSPRS
jgi:hypothetical protein